MPQNLGKVQAAIQTQNSETVNTGGKYLSLRRQQRAPKTVASRPVGKNYIVINVVCKQQKSTDLAAGWGSK